MRGRKREKACVRVQALRKSFVRKGLPLHATLHAMLFDRVCACRCHCLPTKLTASREVHARVAR